MVRLLAALLGLAVLAGAAPALAQVPVYHGKIGVKRAGGRIDPDMGVASLTIRNWLFQPDPSSNGIDPTTDNILIAIGETEQIVLAGGNLKASRNGKKFRFHNPSVQRGVRSLLLVHRADGNWLVNFKIAGIDLSLLTIQFPICQPMAFIIGDDDGFSGVSLDRGPGGYQSKQVNLLGPCTDVAGWPWA